MYMRMWHCGGMHAQLVGVWCAALDQLAPTKRGAGYLLGHCDKATQDVHNTCATKDLSQLSTKCRH